MLKLNNIYKIYENGTLAVRNASLEFPGYGLVAIIGSSGCGKSTLLNLLSNNDIPSKGELLYNDIPYNKVDKDILNKDFAIIYQDFKLIENLSVYQNIMLSHELSNKDIDKDFVLSVADKLGITEILDEKVYSLSGGQQQRVAIARAVVRRPKVIFADEPTGNLDSENTNKVYEILKELSKEILVVIVSHDKVIANYVDRIIEMDNGKILGDYTSEEYYIIKTEIAKQEIQQTEKLNTDIYCNSKKVVKSANIKNNKKPSKIGSKSIFSYTKGKNKIRKNKGLTLNSTLGLTIAFNNKSIAKKVVLSLICIIMTAIILFSVAIIFSTPEKTFYINMKRNKTPFISYSASGRDYNMTEKDILKLNNYIKDNYRADVFVMGKQHYLHNYLGYIEPLNKKSVPQYFKNASLERLNAIFIDNPKDIGINIIIGETAKVNGLGQDEIVISKTYYDYLKTVGKFVNVDNEVVDLSNRDFIGEYIEEFHFTITGVFEDFNEYDLNTSITDDRFNMMDVEYNNFLVNSIIRPKTCEMDMKNFVNYDTFFSGYCDIVDGGSFGSDSFFNLMPLNNFTKKYFYKNSLVQQQLSENEIFISGQKYYDLFKNNVNESDILNLEFVKTTIKTTITSIEKKYSKKDFIIKKIYSKNYDNVIFVNENIFNEFYEQATPQLFTKFVVNSIYVTPNFLKNVRNYCYNNISDEISKVLKTHDKYFELTYSMINFDREDEYNTNLISVMNKYVAIPLFFTSLFILFILLSIINSDIIKTKGKDILILKSFGAKNNVIVKIFLINIIIMTILLSILGVILGLGVMPILNKFWALASNYNIYYDTFYIGWDSILLLVCGIFIVSGLTLCYSINQLNGKSVRKLFQKQKK